MAGFKSKKDRANEASGESSVRFGVQVNEQDLERLERTLKAVREAERAAERHDVTRRVY